jgi:hypothetical protein
MGKSSPFEHDISRKKLVVYWANKESCLVAMVFM